MPSTIVTAIATASPCLIARSVLDADEPCT
jgi:hypothetical protein